MEMTVSELESKNEEPELEAKQEQELVSKQAYVEVRGDMMKYKSQLKEQKALLSQMQAEKDLAAKEKLAEQGKWEDLYNKNQSELEAMKAERIEEKSKFVNHHKKNSIIKELGGFKKDSYQSFINTEAIDLNESGQPTPESVQAEVDRIRQEYPELINSNSKERLPNEAASAGKTDSSYENMSEKDKHNYKKSLLKKPQGY